MFSVKNLFKKKVSPDNRPSLEILVGEENVPKVFGVFSWGGCGAAWLNRLLDAHPDVLSLMGARPHFESSKQEPISYYKTLQIIAMHYKFVGNVHDGIHAYEVPILKEIYGDKFKACGLIRHPVPRFIYSVITHKKYNIFMTFEDFVNGWNLKKNSPLALKVKNILKNNNYSLAHIMMLMNGVEYEQPHGTLFRIEDLRGNLDAVNHLVREITDESIQLNEHMVGTLLGKRIHSFTKSDDYRKLFNDLEPELKILFKEMLTEKAAKIYQEEYGYSDLHEFLS